MSYFNNKKIVILEMANNHMGSIEHGIKIINEFGKICKIYKDIEFVFKLQYRHLDTFIHPKYKNRMDVKFIKRFEETKLSEDQFNELINEMKKNNFKTMSTPFDEPSVKKIVKQDLDYIKVASCSFGDWALLEEIVKVKMPIVASTAAAPLELIDNVVSFFIHRNKDLTLMHCVGEYPTLKENMNLNQIDFMQKRYSNICVGLSSHEKPDDTEIVKMSVAKKVKIFEKHVGFPTNKYSLNDYSVNPEQLKKWLDSMQEAFAMCGAEDTRLLQNRKEVKTLHSLKRGVFIKEDLQEKSSLNNNNIVFAFPPEDGQLTAIDFSKYKNFILKKDLKKNDAVLLKDISIVDKRKQVLDIIKKIKVLVKKSNIVIPNGCELEISHHYGLKKFYEYGICMITVVNRDYCKKLIIVLPGQKHPEQYHKQKEETFHILYGEIDIELDGKVKRCVTGDVVTVEKGVKHKFSSQSGCILEEISSTHIKDDSFYTDDEIVKNKDRKTFVAFWMD